MGLPLGSGRPSVAGVLQPIVNLEEQPDKVVERLEALAGDRHRLIRSSAALLQWLLCPRGLSQDLDLLVEVAPGNEARVFEAMRSLPDKPAKRLQAPVIQPALIPGTRAKKATRWMRGKPQPGRCIFCWG